MTPKEQRSALEETRKANNSRFAALFEIVETPMGYHCQHKVTKQSPQAYDVSCGPQREI